MLEVEAETAVKMRQLELQKETVSLLGSVHCLITPLI